MRRHLKLQVADEVIDVNHRPVHSLFRESLIERGLLGEEGFDQRHQSRNENRSASGSSPGWRLGAEPDVWAAEKERTMTPGWEGIRRIVWLRRFGVELLFQEAGVHTEELWDGDSTVLDFEVVDRLGPEAEEGWAGGRVESL